jgi:hypothetical protein
MTRRFRLAVAVGVMAGTVHLSADDAISIVVRPAVTPLNGEARLSVLVARNDMNRALVWEVDGPGYYRSSAIELAGASSPRSYFFTIRNLPAGSFEIRASVRRNDDSVARDWSRIRVIGADGSD